MACSQRMLRWTVPEPTVLLKMQILAILRPMNQNLWRCGPDISIVDELKFEAHCWKERIPGQRWRRKCSKFGKISLVVMLLTRTSGGFILKFSKKEKETQP